MLTLFCTFTLLPKYHVGAHHHVLPDVAVRSPKVQPGMMWLKCQMRVPAPMVQPSSITAVGWAEYGADILEQHLERAAKVSNAG
jgi:hypothetical protein